MNLAARLEVRQRVHSYLLVRLWEMEATSISLPTHYQESMAAPPQSLVHRSARGSQPWVDPCSYLHQVMIRAVGAWTAEQGREETQQKDHHDPRCWVMTVARAAQNDQVRGSTAMTAPIVATRGSRQLNQPGMDTSAAT